VIKHVLSGSIDAISTIHQQKGDFAYFEVGVLVILMARLRMLRCVAGEVCLEGRCGEFGRNKDGDEIIDAGVLINDDAAIV
jgi:hypothetical protein